MYYADAFLKLVTTAIIFAAFINLRYPAPSVKNWKILLVQSFTACMPLLTCFLKLVNTH